MHQIADQSANGTLSDDWLTPNGVLARVLLLDQFPREVFRGTAAAFQFDAIAAGLVRDAVRTGTFLSGTYSTIQRFFMCVALQHSELLADQVLGVELASQISHDATDDVKQFFMNLPGYPLEHRDVIARFNRFPSRNAALGRVSTAEELSWMASPECPKWARSQMVTPAS